MEKEMENRHLIIRANDNPFKTINKRKKQGGRVRKRTRMAAGERN